MTEYFKAGGFPMWFILFTALASIGAAIASKGEGRTRALWLGSYGTLLFGVLGMALGMDAVSRGVARFPDKLAAMAEGLGELSNNGSFGAGLALALALAAIATRARGENTKLA